MKRFQKMFRLYCFRGCQIGYGPGSFQNPVIASRRQLRTLHQLFHQLRTFSAEPAVNSRICRTHIRIENKRRPPEAEFLPLFGCHDAAPHCIAALFMVRLHQGRYRNRFDSHVQIKAIQDRARNCFVITFNLPGCYPSLLLGVNISQYHIFLYKYFFIVW